MFRKTFDVAKCSKIFRFSSFQLISAMSVFLDLLFLLLNVSPAVILFMFCIVLDYFHIRHTVRHTLARC